MLTNRSPVEGVLDLELILAVNMIEQVLKILHEKLDNEFIVVGGWSFLFNKIYKEYDRKEIDIIYTDRSKIRKLNKKDIKEMNFRERHHYPKTFSGSIIEQKANANICGITVDGYVMKNAETLNFDIKNIYNMPIKVANVDYYKWFYNKFDFDNNWEWSAKFRDKMIEKQKLVNTL